MPIRGKLPPTVTQMFHQSETAENFGFNDYLIIKVEGNATKPEIIINPKENIYEKIEYYKKAYNEDFTLKAKPDIRVTEFMFCTKEQLIKALEML